MKRIFYLLILLLTATNAVAQQYKLDSIVRTISGVQFVASQKNDVENRRAELIRYERDVVTGAVDNLERTQAAYNENHDILHMVHANWNSTSATWDEDEKQENEFNAANTRIRSTSYRKEGQQWVKYVEDVRLESGDTTTSINYELVDNQWLILQKSVRVFTDARQVKSEESYLWIDSVKSLQPYHKAEFSFRQDSIPAGYHSWKWRENKWYDDEKTVYEVNEEGVLTNNYIRYQANDTGWVPTQKFEEYDVADENKQISTFYTWVPSDEQWIKRNEVEILRDMENREVAAVFSEYDEDSKKFGVVSERDTQYDDQNRKSIVEISGREGDEILSKKNTVTYDEKGNVIGENSYMFDSTTHEWKDDMAVEIFLNSNITLDHADASNRYDFFGLDEFKYISNIYGPDYVEVYNFDDGKKELQEKCEYFYSTFQ